MPLAIAGQTWPHVPQFVNEPRKSVSQPLTGFPSQLPNPVVHAPTPHTPEVQISNAFGRLHCTPQAPQLSGELSAVSQPLTGFPSQLPNP